MYECQPLARALRWLTESPAHERMWVLEPDVVYTGNSWADLFR